MSLFFLSESWFSFAELTASSSSCHSQADVGPFLPQRFAPPDYAILNAARGYKQATILEMGKALYGPTDEALDAEAEPTAGQALANDAEDESEGGALWRQKREQFGLSDAPQTAPHVKGQVKEDLLPESSQPRQRQQRGDHWEEQPAAGQGGWRWTLEWQDPEPAHSWEGTWWEEAAWEEEADNEEAYDPWWRSQPASSSQNRQPNYMDGIVDPRGFKVVRLWGSGASRW